VGRHVHRAAPGDHDRREAGVTDELLVFGRTDYAEPLTERGIAAAVADVQAAHPGQWVELVAFPRGAVHWIIREGEDAESERTVRAGR
jgi:hypothetical protein